jgi:NADH-quinone oxidoreductase subunit G
MAAPTTNENLVTIHIDGKTYEVPKGANLVDTAKWHADNDIPVFCYHPKMSPVGMCRMCVVELGTEMRDRQTGEKMLDDDGNPQIRWFPKLQTACTQTVSDGMHIKTTTDKVTQGRDNVLEFLLTSHPLDCPICDKGGECPLQNLTMAHGPGESRMNYADKMHLDKHVPLGDLIYLDEERCIQCARCIRFQDELVGDDVLAFHERGRRLQIITNSEPGFDTYFSGNTTDICPVGALTTADFRFGARPWELTEVPSISPWDAAGENISLSTRLDRDFAGRAMIKRIMPRQNEHVNEIWISDKTRFGHHFTRSAERLTRPMIRGEYGLKPSRWEQTFAEIADAIQQAGGDVAAIAGSGMSNEDLWELRQLVTGLAGDKARLGAWPITHTGADLIAEVGVGLGTRLKDLGKGDAILVIASDLEEEVPMWRFQFKRAQDNGAYLVVANARHTRLEDFATEQEREQVPMQGDAIRYDAGQAAHVMARLHEDHPEIAQKLADADNLMICTGAEGLTLDGHRALMQAAANFLIESGHVGKPKNGLLSTLPGPNGMGLHYMGYTPEATQDIIANPPQVLIVAQAEIAEDMPDAQWLLNAETVITLSLFPDKTAEYTDYALPIQSFAERDGTFINGERRVQRFYTGQGPLGEAIAAWKALASIRERVGQGRARVSAAAVMLDITRNLAVFSGMRYRDLGRVERQYPDVGGEDKYYGGTAYQNKGGIGVQIPSVADSSTVSTNAVQLPDVATDGDLLLLPVTRLYNRALAFRQSEVVHPRVDAAYVALHTASADELGVVHGDRVTVSFGDHAVTVQARVGEDVPAGVAVLPRYLTDDPVPMAPTACRIRKISEAVAVS